MNFEEARINMIKSQIKTWDVFDNKILDLFTNTPREFFVPDQYKELAYIDYAIPLRSGKKMMPPKEEARILQALQVKPSDKCLVLGTDSGFFLCLLAKMSKDVFYVDPDVTILELVKKKINSHHVNNISFITGDVMEGGSHNGPFDIIVLTESLPVIPNNLPIHLNISGRMFMVVGNAPAMEAMLIIRKNENTWTAEKLFETERERFENIAEITPFTF